MVRLFKKHWILFTSILFLVVLFLTFYPTKYISIDENQYLANSYRLLTNSLQVDCDRISEYPGFHYAPNNLCVSKYNLGSSFLLFPTVLIGEQYAFVIVFLAFILSGVFFYWIQQELKINKFFIILYLFYPPFIYFSRTLFSEVFSLLFINIFLYIFIKNQEDSRIKNLITGGVIGIATFVRYTNLVIFAGFLAVYLIKYRDIKKVFFIALGAIPFGLIIMIINRLLYGSAFSTGYSMNGEDQFNIANLTVNLPNYVGLLILIYPLMLFTPIFIKYKYKTLMLLPSLLILFLYSLYPYNFFEGTAVDFIKAGRVLMPIVPMLMLCYVYFLNNKFNRYVRVFVAAALISSTLLVTFFHQRYLIESDTIWESPSSHYLETRK